MTGKDATGNLSEEKGLTRTIQDAGWHRIPLVAAVAAVAVVALIELWFSRNTDHGTRRWEAGGTATETASFRHLAKPTGPGPFSPLLIYLGLAQGPGPIISEWTDWSRPHLSVYSAPAPVVSPSLPTLRDLGDNGQAHAIDFLAKYPTNEKQIWSELHEALRDKKDSEPGEKDAFRFDRILVATVIKGTDWSPGDRMTWTRVFVEPINFSFSGYTVAATENKEVKVTSVEATNTSKISAEIGLAIPELDGSKVSLSPSNEHTIKRTSDVAEQYENLGIDIMPHFLRVIRESEVGGDAIGNTLVSLSVVTDPTIIRRRFPLEDVEKRTRLSKDVVLQVTAIHLEDENGELDKDHASITALPQAPVPHCALRARIWMLYEKRQIDKGGAYYEEARQTVSFLRDADEQRDVDFIDADDVSPAGWSIQVIGNDSTNTTEKTAKTNSTQNKVEENPTIEVLGAHIKNSSSIGRSRELVFTDYGQATKVAHWVRTHQEHEISNLVFDYDGIYSLVPVKNTYDVCRPEYNPNSRRIFKLKSNDQN
jgi:hypothetical protein